MQVALNNENKAPSVQDMQPEHHPQQSQPRTGALVKYNFRFHGNTSEYFGIWLSNVLLTILTLTLYSPWAKSRRMRYFYGNTEVLNRRFDFTGLPSKIFLGRLLALEIYLVLLVLSNYSVILATVGFTCLYIAVPWLFRLTLKFKSRNTKFANSRFFFYGENRYLYRILMIEVIKTIATAFILLPRLIWLYKHYCLDHLQLGQLKFKFTATHQDFMKAIHRPLFSLFALTFALIFIQNYIEDWAIPTQMISIVMGAIWLTGFVFLLPLMLARIYIITWNHLYLGQNYFKTRATQWRYAWIILSNWIAKLITLGLLSAWAEVRLYRYKLEMLDLYLIDDPDDLKNMLQTDPNSLAQELSAMLDFDASL